MTENGIFTGIFDMRITLATPELDSPAKSGDLGRYYQKLAALLARKGHDVTVLWAKDRVTSRMVRSWREAFKEENVEFERLEPCPFPLDPNFHLSKVSYRLLRQLVESPPDVVIFPDIGGIGYYTLLAQREGLLPQSCRLVVTAHRATQTHRVAENCPVDQMIQRMEVDYIESSSVDLANLVVAASPEAIKTLGFPVLSVQDLDKDVEESASLKDFLDRIQVRVERSGANTNTSGSCRISVCIAHYNQPRYLRDAICSIEAQTYQNFECILVDDGSTDPAVEILLAELEPRFQEKGWKILRQPNAGPARARNLAASASTGSHVLFMDSDNIAKPDELQTLANAVNRTGADIYTCFVEMFQGDDIPTSSDHDTTYIWLPLGPSAPVAFFRNCLGDTNFLCKRDVFQRLGGFPLDPMSGPIEEDYIFLLKALLAGCSIHLLPCAPYWYRRNPGIGRAVETFRAHAVSSRLALDMFQEVVPIEVRRLLAYFPRCQMTMLPDEPKQTRAVAAGEDLQTQFLKLQLTFNQMDDVMQRVLKSRRWKLANSIRLMGRKLQGAGDGTLGARDFDKAKLSFESSLERMEAKLQKLIRSIKSLR